MYKAKSLMFLYAVTPVHMGAGQALGVIDNPIQRERHTEHPSLAGAGLKGAFRHAASVTWNDPKAVAKVFGPERDASDHAGAIAFADAQLVAFPVRSLRGGFVYATSPLTLARLQRLAGVAGLENIPKEAISSPADDEAVVLNDDLLSPGPGGERRLVLESYAFEPRGATEQCSALAAWLAETALPEGDGFAFFREKIRRDLVVLSDSQLSFFARNATSVEPHVRIDDETGTADDGGLFFTENLPPESVMVSLAMASDERRRKNDSANGCETAIAILERVAGEFDGRPLQVGGDATTGRGQVIVRFVKEA
ncbi:MAG: type III-B CRISPR module RAMP protein Cmr4 [Candidatus Dadabacteria bacterium]|nr:MAG: type III-B CRISPR module RAMP protein Cmr4 [Candidatus Dadabacteria bacterium]